MDTATTLTTMSDLERRPGRCELINGEILELSPAGFAHGRSSSRAVRLLDRWCEGRPFEVLTCDPGFIWDERTVRAPDVALITAAQAEQAPARGWMPFAPVVVVEVVEVVEVVSPGDEWSEVKEKVRGWLAHGVQMVWVVDPRTRTVEVQVPGRPALELGGREILDGGSILPGFTCQAADFFG